MIINNHDIEKFYAKIYTINIRIDKIKPGSFFVKNIKCKIEVKITDLA